MLADLEKHLLLAVKFVFTVGKESAGTKCRKKLTVKLAKEIGSD
jgi:hypothetical protein